LNNCPTGQVAGCGNNNKADHLPFIKSHCSCPNKGLPLQVFDQSAMRISMLLMG
jgi:hypothetical protein